MYSRVVGRRLGYQGKLVNTLKKNKNPDIFQIKHINKMFKDILQIFNIYGKPLKFGKIYP